MKSCKPKILVSGSCHNIAQCHCCKKLGLYYKSILVSFSHRDFIVFSSSICALGFEQNSVMFPNKVKMLVINTCHKDIQFAFTKTEFEELKVSLQQARLLLEANSIINT